MQFVKQTSTPFVSMSHWILMIKRIKWMFLFGTGISSATKWQHDTWIQHFWELELHQTSRVLSRVVSKICLFLNYCRYQWMAPQLTENSTQNSRVSWKTLIICRCHWLTQVVVVYMFFITHFNQVTLLLFGTYSFSYEICSGYSKTLLPAVPIIPRSRDQKYFQWSFVVFDGSKIRLLASGGWTCCHIWKNGLHEQRWVPFLSI